MVTRSTKVGEEPNERHKQYCVAYDLRFQANGMKRRFSGHRFKRASDKSRVTVRKFAADLRIDLAVVGHTG